MEGWQGELNLTAALLALFRTAEPEGPVHCRLSPAGLRFSRDWARSLQSHIYLPSALFVHYGQVEDVLDFGLPYNRLFLIISMMFLGKKSSPMRLHLYPRLGHLVVTSADPSNTAFKVSARLLFLGSDELHALAEISPPSALLCPVRVYGTAEWLHDSLFSHFFDGSGDEPFTLELDRDSGWLTAIRTLETGSVIVRLSLNEEAESWHASHSVHYGYPTRLLLPLTRALKIGKKTAVRIDEGGAIAIQCMVDLSRNGSAFLELIVRQTLPRC